MIYRKWYCICHMQRMYGKNIFFAKFKFDFSSVYKIYEIARFSVVVEYLWWIRIIFQEMWKFNIFFLSSCNRHKNTFSQLKYFLINFFLKYSIHIVVWVTISGKGEWNVSRFFLWLRVTDLVRQNEHKMTKKIENV